MYVRRGNNRRLRVRNAIERNRNYNYAGIVLNSHLLRGGPIRGRIIYNRRNADRRRAIRDFTHIRGQYVPHIWQRIRRYL